MIEKTGLLLEERAMNLGLEINDLRKRADNLGLDLPTELARMEQRAREVGWTPQHGRTYILSKQYYNLLSEISKTQQTVPSYKCGDDYLSD